MKIKYVLKYLFVCILMYLVNDLGGTVYTWHYWAIIITVIIIEEISNRILLQKIKDGRKKNCRVNGKTILE